MGSLGGDDPLRKEMAACSSVPAWNIPWTEELGGPQSRGRRVRQDQRTGRNARVLVSFHSCRACGTSTPPSCISASPLTPRAYVSM